MARSGTTPSAAQLWRFDVAMTPPKTAVRAHSMGAADKVSFQRLI